MPVVVPGLFYLVDLIYCQSGRWFDDKKKSLQENYKDLPNTTKKETSPTGIEPMLSG